MPFYATYTGHINDGVFTDWEACKREIHKKPKYKKFGTRKEAEHFHAHGPFWRPESDFDVTVYTDGSCRQNGRAGAIGGIGVYFGPTDARNLSQRLEGKATNNIAELTAVIRAIELVEMPTRLGVYTDSTYAMLCAGTYGEKCAKKKWPDDVPNAALVRRLYDLVALHGVQLVHVAAHTGATDIHSVGNHNADQLATAAIS